MLKSLGFRQRAERTWGSGRIDLQRSVDEIRASFDAKYRNQARKAEKIGAVTSISSNDSDFEWIVARHQENMIAKGFLGPSTDFIRWLRKEVGAENMPVFRLDRDGAPVSGGIVYRFGKAAEYYVGWVGPAGREFNAGNHILWRITTEMKHRGCETLDVGGMYGTETYRQFKQGTKPVQCNLAGEWIVF